MIKWDIKSQRLAAIAVLQAKQAVIIHKTKTHRYFYEYYSSVIVYHFNQQCDGVRDAIRLNGRSVLKDWNKHNTTELVWDAVTYVKLEQLIERLQAGERPSIIVLEVLSGDV